MYFNIDPGDHLSGSIRVPGDKSISHRSVMFGSIANGTTRVEGLLEGEDVLATIAAMRAMGVQIEGPDNGRLVIHGAGENGLNAPDCDLDMGNSGTAMRLLIGLLSGQGVKARLVGDESLSKRPMERVAIPLREMGAVISTREGCPPVEVHVTQSLVGCRHQLKIASAQLKSAILLAGLGAEGVTTVVEPAPTRDHTERMLRGFGVDVECEGLSATIRGGQKLHATDVIVPSDISSAAFFIAAAAFSPGSDVTVENVGINPTRTGVLDILALMGASVERLNERDVAGEPVADIRVSSTPLNGIDVPENLVPLAIDEFPILCIAAATARGVTRIRGAEELRVKESDRIAAMADGLKRLGIEVREVEDGMDIVGGSLNGGEVWSYTDHRIAMAFAMAGHVSKGPVRISNCRNVATSFPGFVDLAKSVGVRISVEPAS